MAIPAIQYGPYWKSSRRSEESQKRALGMPGMTPEQIAAERYGELSAYLGDAYNRRNQAFSQNMQLAGLRNQTRQQKAQEGGYKVSGLATLGSLALQTGIPQKAIQGLWKGVFPEKQDTGATTQSGMPQQRNIIEMLPGQDGTYEYPGAEMEPESQFDLQPRMDWGQVEQQSVPRFDLSNVPSVQSSFLGDDFDFSWLFDL